MKKIIIVLISILLTTIVGLFMGVTQLPDFKNYTFIPSIAPTFMKTDFVGLFTAKAGLVVILMTIFTLVISDLFDTIGTFIGTGKKSGIFKLDKNANIYVIDNINDLKRIKARWSKRRLTACTGRSSSRNRDLPGRRSQERCRPRHHPGGA